MGNANQRTIVYTQAKKEEASQMNTKDGHQQENKEEGKKKDL